jgi:hypothetical protein
MVMLWRDPQRRAGGLTVWFAFSLTAVLLAGCGGAGPTIPSSSVTAPAASMPPANRSVVAAIRLQEPEHRTVGPGILETD